MLRAGCLLLMCAAALASAMPIAAKDAPNDSDDAYFVLPLHHPSPRNKHPVQAQGIPERSSRQWSVLPAPYPPNCPACDAIFADLTALHQHATYLGVSPGAGGGWPSGGPVKPDASSILMRMFSELQPFCAFKQMGAYPGNVACSYYQYYTSCQVLAGNLTLPLQLANGIFKPDVLCDGVEFRQLAHSITAYALNASNLTLEFEITDTNPDYPQRKGAVRIDVPNSWLLQQAINLNYGINLLSPEVRSALELNATDNKHHSSIYEVFDTLIYEKNMEYIRATSGSWPFVPPPPPTPRPCPGGNLKACIAMCPATPVEDYKKCITMCFDLCHSVEGG